jgi:hypothetical protein
MRTEHLCRALVADSPSRPLSPRQSFGIALVLAGASAVGLFVAALGPRPQVFGLLFGEPRFAFKVAAAGLLAASSFVLALRLVVPGADRHRAIILVACVPVLVAVADFVELVAVPPPDWGRKLVGANALLCLASIPLLAAAPLAAILLAMRAGAPENPTVAGATAGLLAGGIGATLYAIHCVDDSPLFVSVWYSLAIAMVVATGAVCGSRCLRW